ncbi:hypothetical protein [Delftia lacustris]|uniref:hypothetical protein n=1 Tax=Delftia lacustris TaxID=558537 RepID=UPI001EEFFFD2|nr:hypothetical protein [Delftia lacustris]
MSTNQIEQRADARSAMQRTMEGVRSARAAQPPSNEQAAGFSSLLAAMDGIGGLPDLGQVLGDEGRRTGQPQGCNSGQPEGSG